MNTAVAEKAVIGIMLIEPDRQSEAFKSLTAQMFSIKDLGDIFLLCKELDRRGERADAVSIISRCKENIKAIAYECARTVPSVSGFNTYINCVLDGYRKRLMIAKMGELVASDADADEMFGAVAAMMEKQQHIMEHQRQRSAKDFADGIEDFLQWLKKPNDNIQTGFGTLDKLTGGLTGFSGAFGHARVQKL